MHSCGYRRFTSIGFFLQINKISEYLVYSINESHNVMHWNKRTYTYFPVFSSLEVKVTSNDFKVTSNSFNNKVEFKSSSNEFKNMHHIFLIQIHSERKNSLLYAKIHRNKENCLLELIGSSQIKMHHEKYSHFPSGLIQFYDKWLFSFEHNN